MKKRGWGEMSGMTRHGRPRPGGELKRRQKSVILESRKSSTAEAF